LPSIPGVLDPADPRPAPAASLRDWLALQWALALDPVAAAELLRATRNPRDALEAAHHPRRAAPRDLDAAIERLCDAGARAIPLLSPVYPPRLARLPDPAPLLLVRGDVDALAAPSVAIVGSRAATAYGLYVAQELAGGLARAGVVVVSGLALGIDGAAHRGALEAGGRTVAVLACGPDRVYPARHRDLARRIEGQGAIVSELPPGTQPLRAFFPLRNRLISGMASAVVVVEARERSGSLITAGHAANQGVDVFAVPGPITAPTSAGPNRLLREGAYIALEAGDVLAELGIPALADGAPADRASAAEPSRQSPSAEAILDALEREPATRDQLGQRLARAPEQLALDLLELELQGRVFADRDGRWRLGSRPHH
jgi:DNA processing protein